MKFFFLLYSTLAGVCKYSIRRETGENNREEKGMVNGLGWNPERAGATSPAEREAIRMNAEEYSGWITEIYKHYGLDKDYGYFVAKRRKRGAPNGTPKKL